MYNTSPDKLGAAGKELVKDYLARKGYVITSYQSDTIDYVDFYATNPKTQQVSKVFVRTDTKLGTTGNMVVERFMYREDKNGIEIGWLFNGKADILYYLDAYYGKIFCFDWERLKVFVTTNFKARSFNNNIDAGTIGDAYIIPIRKIRGNPCCIAEDTVDTSSLAKFDFQKPTPF